MFSKVVWLFASVVLALTLTGCSKESHENDYLKTTTASVISGVKVNNADLEKLPKINLGLYVQDIGDFNFFDRNFYIK
jgi:hypothetical protein